MPPGGGEGRRFHGGDRRADFHEATFLISCLIRRKNDFVQGRIASSVALIAGGSLLYRPYLSKGIR
jgi:hypothetical protein